MSEVNKTKDIAAEVMLRTLGPGFLPLETIWKTLGCIHWNHLCTGNFSQQDIAVMNLALDPHSCLGRIALSISLIEKYFPELTPEVRCAEVTSDFFRAQMLRQWSERYSSQKLPPEGWLEELLMYEEPHAILTIGGQQFDPLFCLFAGGIRYPGEEMVHPAVQEFSSWEAVTAFRLVSKANLLTNIEQKVDLLRKANSVCPGTCLVWQNLIGPLMLIGGEDDISESKLLLTGLCDVAPSIRSLMSLRLCFGETHHATSEYDEHLFSLLETTVGKEHGI